MATGSVVLSLLAALDAGGLVDFHNNGILVVTWAVFFRTLLRILRIPVFLKSIVEVWQWRSVQHRLLVQRQQDDAAKQVQEEEEK